MGESQSQAYPAMVPNASRWLLIRPDGQEVIVRQGYGQLDAFSEHLLELEYVKYQNPLEILAIARMSADAAERSMGVFKWLSVLKPTRRRLTAEARAVEIANLLQEAELLEQRMRSEQATRRHDAEALTAEAQAAKAVAEARIAELERQRLELVTANERLDLLERLQGAPGVSFPQDWLAKMARQTYETLISPVDVALAIELVPQLKPQIEIVPGGKGPRSA